MIFKTQAFLLLMRLNEQCEHRKSDGKKQTTRQWNIEENTQRSGDTYERKNKKQHQQQQKQKKLKRQHRMTAQHSQQTQQKQGRNEKHKTGLLNTTTSTDDDDNDDGFCNSNIEMRMELMLEMERLLEAKRRKTLTRFLSFKRVDAKRVRWWWWWCWMTIQVLSIYRRTE